MPKARKPVTEGGGPPGVQWAPVSTVNRAAMMPQPRPMPPMAPGGGPTPQQQPPRSASAFPPPSSEVPPPPLRTNKDTPHMLRGTDIRMHQHHPPALPSNGPLGHHHYIPTPPNTGGRGTPTNPHRLSRPTPPPPSSNFGPQPPHGGRHSPFPPQLGGPSSHVLPSVERPLHPGSTGRRTPVSGRERGPARSHGFKHAPPPPIRYQGPQQHQHAQQPQEQLQQQPRPPRPPRRSPTGSRHASPSATHGQPTEAAGSSSNLTDDEIRRLQRFMSLNWQVGVINHPPFARPEGPPLLQPAIAGFVGSQGQVPASGSGGPRPPR